MDIRTLKLSDLNPAKYNPRKELKPGDTEFEKLKRSIESFGYVELIVVNETTGFTVISGHQRLSVLKALGYDSVECIVVSLDATREKALNIAMNKISGEWDTKKLSNLLSDLKAEDFDVTLTGFDTSEIGLMLGVDDMPARRHLATRSASAALRQQYGHEQCHSADGRAEKQVTLYLTAIQRYA